MVKKIARVVQSGCRTHPPINNKKREKRRRDIMKKNRKQKEVKIPEESQKGKVKRPLAAKTQ
ncbi:hypothetical protein [Evansella clarkii]|uniref:hypothetical protein n=1 Tax=Evansella clarkii TaxID=79879 RepID=UPI001ADC2833|nr:hypothetical protein [Evansella clarkii]